MQTELFIAIAAVIVALLALAWSWALSQRVRQLTAVRGELGRMAAAGDFAGIAAAVEVRMDNLAIADERLSAADDAIAERLGHSVRHTGLVRFDALPGDVGENSFALALMDDHATGFVLTSMYGRGAYRLYAKPITDGNAELVLTEEESEACRRALRGTNLRVQHSERPRRV